MLDGEITPEDLAAVNRLEVRLEAAKIVEAAEAAVESGEVTAARAASMILSAGTPAAVAAHDTFLESRRLAEAVQYRVESLVDALDSDSIEEYAAEYESRRAADQAKAVEELQSAREDLARAQLDELSKEFQRFVSTVPGANAERLADRIRSKVIETNSAPEDDASRARFVAESAREIDVADNVTHALTEEAEAAWRSVKSDIYRRSGVITGAEAKRIERDYIDNYVAQKAETTLIPASAFELPLTAEEETAKALEHVTARNDQHQAFADNVGGMRARAGRPERDRGEIATEEKAKFREAMERAEAGVTSYVPPPGSSQ